MSKNQCTTLILLYLFLQITSVEVFAKEDSSRENSASKDALATEYAYQVTNNARNNPESALAIATKALGYFAKENYPKEKATVLNESSYALYFLARYPESMQRAKEAEVFAREYGLRNAQFRAIGLQANVLQAIGAYPESLSLYQKALTFYRSTADLPMQGGILRNIANTYFAADDYESALIFYRQAEGHAVTERDRAAVNLGIGNSFSEHLKFDLANEHFNLALQQYRSASDLLGEELALSGLATLFRKQEKNQDSIELLELVIASSRKGGRLFRVSNLLNQKAFALINLEEFEPALRSADEALRLAKQIGDTPGVEYALRAKLKVYEKQELFNEFLSTLKEANDLSEKITGKEKKLRLEVMKVLHDLESKDHEINLLKAENAFKQALIDNQMLTYITFVIGFLLLFSAYGFFIYLRIQRRKLNAQLKISQELEELDKLKTQVLANTSHELRTPLNGIIGMAELLLDDDMNETEEMRREHIKIIAKSGSRLLRLIEDILDLTQLQAKRVSINSEQFQIKPLLSQVCQLLEPLALKKDLRLSYSVVPDSLKVNADKGRIHQVLVNLIGNAIKFSQSGVVEIEVKADLDRAIISVKDQGPGISDDNLALIFEPFGQVDGGFNRDNEGTGLGLPITKELLLLHNSELQIETQLGKGTRFFFNLPQR